MAATDDTRTQRPKTGATFSVFRTFCLLTAMVFLNPVHGQTPTQTSLQRLEQMAQTLNTSFVTPLLNTWNGQVDLIFVLDRSASIGWYNGAWDSMLQFVENLLYEFSVNSVHTRVSIITYSTTVSVDVDYLSDGSASSRLTKCKLNDDIEKRLRNKALHGWTATTTALERAKQVVLTSRPAAKKAIFLLTDGRSNIGQPPSIPAREIANLRWSGWDMATQGRQVEIFALGIEDAVEAELRSIANPSQEDHYFFLDNFQDFSLLARLLHGDQQEEFWSVTDRSYCDYHCGSHSTCSCPSKSGYATCSCEEGYGGDGHLCTACPVGTYKDTLSPTECTTCPEGTTTMGTGATRRDHCVCGEGTEERNGTCAVRSCPILPAIQHASMVHVNGRVIGDVNYNVVGMQPCRNTPGDTCYIRCDTGYRASGEHSLYCNTSFVWEGTLPTCNVVTCGPYPNVSDSTMVYNHSASGPHTYNSTLEIQCDAGRTPIFDTARTCLANGLWSGARATTYCKSVECPNLEVPAFASVSPPECGYRKHPHGTQCNVTCSEGFELRGGAAVQTCGTGDRWSHHGSTLTCRDVQPPTLVCPPDILTYSDPGMNSTLLHWVVRPTTLTDNDGTVPSYTVHPNHPNPHHFDVGVHVLFYSATDTYGLTSQCQRHIRVENDKPPTLLSCPGNMEVTVQSASGHVLEWTDPVYVDDNNQSVPVECTANKGQAVSLGSHNVYCWAQNFPRNNRCKFIITLLPPACEVPDPPRNGVAVCGSIPNFQRYCTVRCNNRYDFATSPADAYSCDYSGNWHGSPFPWPDCSGRVRPGRATQKNDLYYYHGNCAENIEEIKQGFLQLYNTLQSSDCSAVNPAISCNVTDIEVECDISLRRRRDVSGERTRTNTEDHSVVKRQTQQANLKIFFVIVAVYGDGGDVSQENQVAITTALDDFYFEIGHKVDNKTLDLPLGNETLESLHYTGFLAEFELNCAPGQLAKIESYGASCVNCPVGTYGNGTACVPCAVGWYQDEETQTQCKQCPVGSSTLSEGSKNSTDCKGFCQPGTFSDTGLEDCSPCDIGFYQPDRNASTCLACPDDKSTVSMNSTSPDQCFSHCLAGHFSPTGLQPCEPCPLNTYNPNPGRRSCVDCPGTQETFFLGASSPNNCFVNDNCHSDPCQNGATCEDLVGGYQCHCTPGYNGTNCEQDLDDCASNPCNNNGTCQDLVNGFNCTCVSGYAGDTCQMEVNECASSPCQHGGTCIDLFNTYQCYCLPGYTGHSCQQEIDECASSPCLSGASCVDEVDGYSCECPPGFAGDHCDMEIDECQSQPCLNGGTCNDQVNGYNCSCVDGWAGTHCEVDIDDCQGVTCQNGGTCYDRLNDFVCDCFPSFSGKTCQQENSADFDLVFTKTTTADYAMLRPEFLHNLPQFTLCTWLRTSDTINTGTIFSYAAESNFLNRDNTLTLSDPAHLTLFVNGEEVLLNSAVNDGLWHHVCVSWVSADGSWEFYLDGNLQNSGTGLATGTQVMGGGVVVLGQDQDSLGGSFHPREAYLGELSRLNLYDDKLSAGDVEVLATTCVDRTGGTVLAWGDFRPDGVLHGDLQPRTPSWCQDTNECLNSVLCNGRECQDTRGSYQCVCPAGWTGQNCDVNINECSSSPCTYGVCTDGINGYTCNCSEGYTGKNCDEVVDPCEKSPCKNGGTCVSDSNNFVCSCTEPSIMNEVCEYETPFCGNNPCQNGGTCLNLRDGYTCTCPTGFGGTNCSLSVLPCDSNPCFNNGTCTSYPGGFQCSCPPLYIGSQCQVYNNPCMEGQSPCLNNGTCQAANNGRGYECVCQSPETQGENCEELLPCAVAQKQAPPCQNNGTCVNNGTTGYLCDCPSGFNGEFCETMDYCASTPCINGGTCQLESGGYTCRCTEPAKMDANCRYLGTTPAPTPCDPNPCLHGGHCETRGSDFVCRCAVKLEGITCNRAYELYDTTIRLNLVYSDDLRTQEFDENFIRNFQKMFQATGLPGKMDVTQITDVRSGSVIVDFTAKHSILANETRPDVNTMRLAMEDQLSTGRMGDLAAHRNGFAMSIQGVMTTTTPKRTPAPQVAENTLIIIIVVVLVCVTVIVVAIVAAVVRTRKQKRTLPPTPTAKISYQNKAFRGSRDSGIMQDIGNQSMLPGQRFDQHIYEDLKEYRIDHYAESDFVPKTELDNAVNQFKSAKSRRDLPPVPSSPQYTDMSGATNTLKQAMMSEEYVLEDNRRSTYQDLKPSEYQGLVKPHKTNQQVRKRNNSTNDHSVVYQNEAYVNDEILPSPPPGSKIVYEDDCFEGAMPSTRL